MKKKYKINLHILETCNFKCRQCFSKFGTEKLLPVKDWEKIVDNCIAGADVTEFNIAGGEPMLYPGLVELVKYIRNKGVKISLITNGSLMDEEWIKNYAGLYETTVVRQPMMTADEVKSSKEKASKTNEATLLKIAKEQAAEIEKLKAELSSAKQALEAKDAECVKLKDEYSALQTKYVMSAELFAERVYKMAMSPKPDFSADDSDCGNIVTIKNS